MLGAVPVLDGVGAVPGLWPEVMVGISATSMVPLVTVLLFYTVTRANEVQNSRCPGNPARCSGGSHFPGTGED